MLIFKTRRHFGILNEIAEIFGAELYILHAENEINSASVVCVCVRFRIYIPQFLTLINWLLWQTEDSYFPKPKLLVNQITAQAIQEIRHLLWNSMVYCCAPPVPFTWILIFPSHLHVDLPCDLVSSFHIKSLYLFLMFAMSATCPSHFILLHFITKINLN